MKISKVKNRNLYRTSVKKPDGSFKQIYGRTKKEVKEKAESLITNVRTGKFVETKKILLKDWLREWYENYLIDITEQTKRKYIAAIENNIIPYFGNKSLQKLTHNDCQQFVQYLNKKYSPKTVRNIVNILHRSLKDGVRNGYISVNPSEDLILPKKNKPKMNVLDFSEVIEFIEKAYELAPDYADCYEFLLLTGLRLGEFIGLTLDDYNSDSHILRIDKQYHVMLNKFTPPKHGVEREVALTDRAVEIIEKRIEMTERIRTIYPEFNPDNLIFLNPGFKIMTQTTLRKYMKKVCAEIGRPEMRIHDLRHTFATLTLAAGTDIKTLQERLGHSDATFTMNKYAHSTQDMNIHAAEDLGFLYSNLKKLVT